MSELDDIIQRAHPYNWDFDGVQVRWIEKMDGGYEERIPRPTCTAACPVPEHDNKARAEKGLGPAHCSLQERHQGLHLCGCRNKWDAPVPLDESFED